MSFQSYERDIPDWIKYIDMWIGDANEEDKDADENDRRERARLDEEDRAREQRIKDADKYRTL